jgi:hypothetical protein
MVIGWLGVNQVVCESPGCVCEVLWWLLGVWGVGARLGGAYLCVSGSKWGKWTCGDVRWGRMVKLSSWSGIELLQGGWVDAVWFGWVVVVVW